MNETKKQLHVAVIGAGPSGLVSIKELLEEGHQVTCFEKAQDIGGVYLYNESKTGVFKSTQLTSSSFITCFSDFPPPKNAPFHFKHTEYLQYLKDYTKHFNLSQSIKFNHAVTNISQMENNQWKIMENNQWKIKVCDTAKNLENEHIFDAIALCSGAHQIPSTPNISDQELFSGKIIHSSQYKEPSLFQDQNIVVVGGGESGSDIVEEISEVTKKCILSLRRGLLTIPRLTLNLPTDYYTNRLFYSLPNWLFRIRHPKRNFVRDIILLILSILLFIIPLFLLSKALSFFIPSNIFIFLSNILNLLFSIFLVVILLKLNKTFLSKNFRMMAKLSRESLAGHGEQFATKCEGISKTVAQKKCILKPQIKKFTKDTVVFSDESTFEVDTVIFCTGFKLTLPMLNIPLLDTRNLYKNCFDLNFGSTLCFVGFARPAIGSVPPISELQARWFARILNKENTLPDIQTMKKEIEEDKERHKKTFRIVSDRLPNLVDFTSYMDQLAKYIDCKPQLKNLLKNPNLLFKMYYAPFAGYQYRLQGPHSKKNIAIKAFKLVPINPVLLLVNYGLLAVNITCKILYKLKFQSFKNSLNLD